MRPLWRGVSIAAIILLFVLAVAASTQGITVGLPQSMLLLAVVLTALRLFRDDRDAFIRWSLIVFGAGVVVRLLSAPPAQVLSDSLIALAIVAVAVFLIGPPLARLPMRLRSMTQRTGRRLAMPVPMAVAPAGMTLGNSETSLSGWLPFLIAALILMAIATRGHVLGAQSASVQWNMHLFTTPLLRDGGHLNDPSVIVGTLPASVAFADSLLLSLCKVLIPAAWPPFFGNLITLLGLALFVFSGVRFLQLFAVDRASAVAAVLLFLLLPVGLPIRFAAPFDLSLALLAVVWTLSKRATSASILVLGFAIGLVNTANGYEYAAIVLAAWACNLGQPTGRTVFLGWAAAVAVAGSLVAALGLSALSPIVSFREVWWFAEEIPRIVWAEALHVWWLAIAGFTAIAAAGLYAMIRQGAGFLRFTLALLILSFILALPTRLGGIPLLSPADLLGIVAPKGWPSARFVELLAFALTIPVAYAISIASPLRRRSYASALNWVAAAILIVLCLPRTLSTVLPGAAANAATVEFPIAEAHSRAGIMYAEDLLAAKARVVQPFPFIDTASPLTLESSPTEPAAVKAMKNLGVRTVVLREDVYAKPAWRVVVPRLPDEAFSAIPNIAAPYPWRVFTFVPAAQGT
ncbi:MAG: hypothetical protein JO193_05795 [Candidatus Eremiobacteraeota bacterium]|nr:hypothetical protein [Candidatus Eremiobacteraeota bacterium]MBV9972712.1 hypothetical protein [Candidatus Eremiobacteraeota bacterium]